MSRRHNVIPMLRRQFESEAGGQAQGGPADASAGLSRMTAGDGGVWAWNPTQAQWQKIHVVRSGDTIWNLTGTYYGTPSLDRVNAIGNVPQNKPILGTLKDQAVPGDVILIPNLSQPAAAPSAPTPPPVTPAPTFTPTMPTTPPVTPSPTFTPTGPAPSPPPFVPGVVPIPTMIPGTPPSGPSTPPSGPLRPLAKAKKKDDELSTGQKVGIVAGVSVVLLATGFGIWAAGRKKRRRRRAAA